MREIFYRGQTTGGWIYCSPLSTNGCGCFWDWIDPETLGQYTGLDDKNGVKIFEGDIVESDNGYVGDVQFSHGVFGVEWVRCKQKRDMVGRQGALHNLRKLDDGFNAKMRVIGNIHDNPELLEEKKW